MEDLAAEDDGYSDDDLDALPDQAFHEIQQNAIQSTLQPNRTAQAQLPTLAQPSRHEAAALSAPLGRLNVGASSSHNAHQHALHAPSSDYGDFDDEMLDGEILDAAEQPAFAAHYEARNAHPKHEESIPNEHYRPYDYGPAPPYYKPPETQRYVNLSAAASTPMISRDASRFHTANDEIGVPAQIANQNASAPPVQSTADVATLQDQVLKVCFRGSENAPFLITIST